VPIDLVVNGKKICTYTIDFVEYDTFPVYHSRNAHIEGPIDGVLASAAPPHSASSRKCRLPLWDQLNVLLGAQNEIIRAKRDRQIQSPVSQRTSKIAA
jgi:hypothetical protein